MRINTVVRVIAAVLAVIWMVRIFSYSSAPAEVSMQTSRSVSFDIVSSFNDLMHLGWDEDRILGVSRSIEKAVRKLAHMAEFAVLGLLVGTACDAWRYVDGSTEEDAARSGFRHYIYMSGRGVIAFLICLVYACSDELHQTFVDGRSGEVRDVVIDVSGALIAIVLTAVILRIVIRHFGHKSGDGRAFRT
ncbi:MAG: VanZ family protein [Lachnospiraceae bacterium]|nr:VanZ family protein [Lachnospiraceae bacterium]